MVLCCKETLLQAGTITIAGNVVKE